MIKRNKIILILTGILILAIFLRFYQLSNVPPSASLDEASIGYNAYSILQTGKDEYGYRFPVLLRAYDDWRPALYAYLVIPFIKILGLNVLAVRLPSVILSMAIVLATYFLAKELFPKAKQFSIFNFQFSIGEISAFLLAISPWNIYVSRLGHEANAGLFFVVFSILFFLKSVNSKTQRLFLSLSAIFFALSFYTYQSEKIFVPLMIIALAIIYRKKLWQMKKIVFFSIVLGLAIALPITIFSLSPEALIRFKGTTAFDSNNPLYFESAKLLIEDKKQANIVGEILHNRRVTTARIFVSNYFSHFSPRWLFANEGSESFKAPGVGLLYLWEFPFILLGILSLVKNNYSINTKSVVVSWILITFIAPAITTGAPHAMRSYNILPIPQILTGLGLTWLFGFFPKKQILYLSFFLLTVIFSQVIYFFNRYFFVFPKQQSSSFQYALSKAIPFVLNNQNSYNRIIFSNQDNLYQSYMFFLFYSKYNPELYQKEGGTKSGGFAKTHKLGKFEFHPIDYLKEKKDLTTLYIGNPSDFPQFIKPKTIFKNLDGKDAVFVLNK